MKIRSLCISIITGVLAVAAVSLVGCGNGRGGGGKSAGPASAGVTAASVRDQASTPPSEGAAAATPDSDQAPRPPATPAWITATPGSDQVTLSWPEVAGATSYNIYWSLFPGVTTTNGTTVSVATGPYTHTSLTVETTYYYIVTALNASGESAASSEVKATTLTPGQTKSFLRYRRAMKPY